MDTGAHTQRKMDTVLQPFSCLFVPVPRKLLVICKQYDEKMQRIKHGVSSGHACRGKTLGMTASALK